MREKTKETRSARHRRKAAAPPPRTATDELGAHVSTAGGVQNAPVRAAEIDAAVIQLFTKQPNRWAEPRLDPQTAETFAAGRSDRGIRFTAAHDSYLINLASPDPALHDRSYASFAEELRRCELLGIDCLVTHPGNATDGDASAGLARNAAAIARALDAVPGRTVVLLETTAGSGRVLGAAFEQLAELRDAVPLPLRNRVGFCVDTCHVWAAGYDLRGDYDGVIGQLDRLLGLSNVRLLHLNDSVGVLGSRRDRHAHIGEGTLGEEPFRSIMRDERLASIPKVLETPKDDDYVASDRRNLRLLRSFRD